MEVNTSGRVCRISSVKSTIDVPFMEVSIPFNWDCWIVTIANSLCGAC